MGSGKIDFRTTTEMVKLALRKETEEAEEKRRAKKKATERSPKNDTTSDAETSDEV